MYKPMTTVCTALKLYQVIEMSHEIKSFLFNQ